MQTDPNLPTDPATPPVEPPATPPANPAPDEMALFRSQLAQERQAREDAERKLKQQEEDALKKSKNWEELARIKGEEAENNKKKYDLLQNTIVNNEKLTRLKSECIKLGINPEAMDDLDYMVDNLNITVEATSTGKILVHGADSAAQLVKARKPHWFSVKPASVNPASPSVTIASGGKTTVEICTALEREYKKTPTPENKQKYMDAVIKLKQGL